MAELTNFHPVSSNAPLAHDPAREPELYAAARRVAADVEAVRDDELEPVNRDVDTVVSTVLGANKRVQPLLAALATMPGLDMQRVRKLGDYADALHDVLGELKEPVDLVGYHTGALIAAEYALRYPNDVRRLVLMSMPLFSAERRATLNTSTLLTEDGSHLLGEWRSTMRVRPPGQSLEQAARIVAEKQRAGTRAGWASWSSCFFASSAMVMPPGVQ